MYSPTAGGSAAPRQRAAMASARTVGRPTDPAAAKPVAYPSATSVQPAGAGGAAPMYEASSTPSPYTRVGSAPVQARSLPMPATTQGQVTTTQKTAQGQSVTPGANPYNPNAPRYQGIDDADISWANKALGATYVGKSGGKMRFRAADGQEFTNDDRNHAQTNIIGGMRTQDKALSDPMSGQSLRSRFGAFTDKLQGTMDGAEGMYFGAADGADRGQADADSRIQDLSEFQPTETAGFDLSFLRDQRPTAQEGVDTSKLANFNSDATRGWTPAGITGVNTSTLKNYNGGKAISDYLDANGGGDYDTSAQAGTSNFDPRAAMEEYARGAAGIAKVSLDDGLEASENAAVRSGRLNTGLFDRDKGRVISRVGEDLNNQILARAVDAAGIKASIENANSGNVTQANIASLRERGNKAGLRSAEARDAGQLGYQALNSATGYDVDLGTELDRLSLDQADNIDRNTLTATDAATGYNLKKAQGIDDFMQTGATNYADAEGKRRTSVDEMRYGARRDSTNASIDSQNNRLKRLDLSQQLWDGAQDRVGDALSGERDRVTSDENAAAELAQREKERKTNFWGGMATGVIRGGTALVGG